MNHTYRQLVTAVATAVALAFACAPPDDERQDAGSGSSSSGSSSGNASSTSSSSSGSAQFSQPQIIAGALHSAHPVAADATHVYWGTEDGVIYSATHDGTSVAPLASGQGVVTDLKIDAEHVYWGSLDARVAKAHKTNGTVTPLVPSEERAHRIAIDATHVYWTNEDAIRRVGNGGGAPAELVTGLSYPSGIAVDTERIYFATNTDGTLRSVALDGSDPLVLAYGQEYPDAVIVDGDRVYWTTARTVMSINKHGGEQPVSHAPVHRSDPQWVTTDATHIYYANTDEGSVERVPRGGGEMEVLVVGQGTVQGIAVIGQQLFYASSSNGIVGRVVWQ